MKTFGRKHILQALSLALVLFGVTPLPAKADPKKLIDQKIAQLNSSLKSQTQFLSLFAQSKTSLHETNFLKSGFPKLKNLKPISRIQNTINIGDHRFEILDLEKRQFRLNGVDFTYESKIWPTYTREWEFFSRLLKNKQTSSILSTLVPFAQASGLEPLAPIASTLARELSELSNSQKIIRLYDRLVPIKTSNQRSRINLVCQNEKDVTGVQRTMQSCFDRMDAGGRIHKLEIHFKENQIEKFKTFFFITAGSTFDCVENCAIQSVAMMDSTSSLSSLAESCTRNRMSLINLKVGLTPLTQPAPPRASNRRNQPAPTDEISDPQLASQLLSAVQGCCAKAESWFGNCTSALAEESQELTGLQDGKVTVQPGVN